MCVFVFVLFIYFTAVDDCNVSNHKPYEWLEINFDCRRENGLLRILICVPVESCFFFYCGRVLNTVRFGIYYLHPNHLNIRRIAFLRPFYFACIQCYIISCTCQIREHYSRTTLAAAAKSDLTTCTYNNNNTMPI